MRNGLLFLTLMAVSLLAIVVLLPILGVLLLVVAALLVILVGAFLAAPLLAKLPWFRDRIVVEQWGNRKIIRFGRASSRAGDRPGYGARPGNQGDVLDAEFKVLPDEDDKP